jgi:hypothetical protein
MQFASVLAISPLGKIQLGSSRLFDVGDYQLADVWGALSATLDGDTLSSSGTVGYVSGESRNNFSSDTNCKACWKFDSGLFGVDSIGGFNLAPYGGSESSETEDFRQGDACIELSGRCYWDETRTIPVGYPLRDANKKISIVGWFRYSSIGSGVYSVYDTLLDQRVLTVLYGGDFSCRIGINGGTGSEVIFSGGSPEAGKWYHFGFTLDDSDKSWKLVVFDRSANSKIINTSGNYINSIHTTSYAAVMLGAVYSNPYPGQGFNGRLDEIAVFDDVLTFDEIDEIRQGTFMAADFQTSVGENAPIISDSISALLVRHKTAFVSDVLRPITEAFYPPWIYARHMSAGATDESARAYDDIFSQLLECHIGSVPDSLSVIRDQITTSLINILGGSQRWVAPVSIRPRTHTVYPLYLAAHPVRHPDKYFEPRIRSYGTFTRAITAPVGFIRTGDSNLTVIDPDNSVRQRIAAKTIFGGDAEVRLGPEGGSYTGFLRPLSRQVGTVTQPTDGELVFPLHDYLSTFLDQSIPGLIDLVNFPNLPESSAGEFAPIIFGWVSCRSEKLAVPPLDSYWQGLFFLLVQKVFANTDGGAIRAILVNVEAGNYKYIVARHPCRYIEVWRKKSGEDQFTIVPDTTYELLTETIASGHTVQLVKFAQNQNDAEIRINAEGIYDSDRFTFVGFFGKTGPDYITNIGLIVRDGFTGNIAYSELAGNNQNPINAEFGDSEIPDGSHISAILIWAGAASQIHALQLEYTDENEAVTYGIKHGGPGGDLSRFEILPDERIESISGHSGQHIDELVITSNLVSVAYGGVNGTDHFSVYVDQSQGANFADAILEMLTDYIGIPQNMDRINLSSFDSVRSKVQDLVCAGAITEQISWGEAISRLQRSSNIDIFSDKNDRITAKFTTDDEIPSLNLSDLMRLYKGSVKQQLAGPAVNHIAYRYSPNFASEKWTEGVLNNIGDQEAVGGVVADEPLQLYFVRDADTALAVVEHRSQYLDLDSFRFEGEIPLIPTVEEIELGDVVSIDHFGGIKEGGYVGEQFKILELSMDIDNLKYQFKGIRRKLPPPEVVESTSIGGRRLTNSRTGPYYNGIAGELFGVFLHPTELNKIIVQRTTDYGANWSESDAPHSPALPVGMNYGYGVCTSFDSVAGSGLIHVATQETDGSIRYHCYDMDRRLWTVTDQVVSGSLSALSSFCVSIDLRYPDGRPFIYFQGNSLPVSGVYYARGYYSQNINGAWSVPELVTPDPGQYSENSGGGYWPAHLPSSNCIIERIVPGRNNRMHCFYSVAPAVHGVQSTPDFYSVTISEDGAISDRAWLFETNFITIAAERNIGGFCFSADRSVIYTVRRLYNASPYVLKFSEGQTLSYIWGGWNLSGSFQPHSDETQNPNGFVALDAFDEHLVRCVVLTSTPGYVQLINRPENNAEPSEYIQAGPVEIDRAEMSDRSDLVGNIFTVRGRQYIAYFLGDMGGVTKFRWLQVDKLPYTG